MKKTGFIENFYNKIYTVALVVRSSINNYNYDDSAASADRCKIAETLPDYDVDGHEEHVRRCRSYQPAEKSTWHHVQVRGLPLDVLT